MSQSLLAWGYGMILPDWDFPGGPLVEKPPSNEGDIGLIPSQGTRISHAQGGKVCGPQLENCQQTAEPMCPGAGTPQLERSHHAATERECHD